MLEKTLVSVVVITYNHAGFIYKSLKSIYDQNVDFRIEVLISNDCSTDHTDEVIKEFIKEFNFKENINILYFNHEKNLGMRDNFLFALNKASGEYIALCEGDDFWIDDLKLKKQVDVLKKNDDTSIVCGGYKKIYENEEELSILGAGNGEEIKFTLEDWSKLWYTKTLTVLFRKSALKQFTNLSNNYIYTRDIHLYYHLLKEGKGIYLSSLLGGYNIHIGGVCSMVSISANAIHNFNCWNEIRSENNDKISKHMYIASLAKLMSLEPFSMKKIRVFFNNIKYCTSFRDFLLLSKYMIYRNKMLK